MRRASLSVAVLAILCTPAIAIAQTVSRPNEVPVTNTPSLSDRDVGGGSRDLAGNIVPVSDPIVVPQKTRSLAAKPSNKGRIDFGALWQTGIYQ